MNLFLLCGFVWLGTSIFKFCDGDPSVDTHLKFAITFFILHLGCQINALINAIMLKK